MNGYDIDGFGGGYGTYTLSPFDGSFPPSRPASGTYARLDVDSFFPEPGYPLTTTTYVCGGEIHGPAPGGTENPLQLVGLAPVAIADPQFTGTDVLIDTYTWTEGDGFYTRTVTIRLSRSLIDSDLDGLPDDVDPTP